MTYQIGTFFVKENNSGSYQICYMLGMSTNPEKLGQPCGLVENAGIRYLRLSSKEYRVIMEKLGAEYKVLFRTEHRNFPENVKHKAYEHGEMFFADKEQAEKAMDWANARLAELHLLGQQYQHGEELRGFGRMPMIQPSKRYQPPTPPKGSNQ